MREILFRAKRKDNGEWVEGLLWKKKYNTDKLFISCFPDKDDNEEVFVVAPSTVCQFTGLTDINGTKIFEGDIVKPKDDWQEYDETIKGYVCFGHQNCGCCHSVYGFAICEQNGKPSQYISFYNDLEIIGNIIDNKELLERENNENI